MDRIMFQYFEKYNHPDNADDPKPDSGILMQRSGILHMELNGGDNETPFTIHFSPSDSLKNDDEYINELKDKSHKRKDLIEKFANDLSHL